MKRGLLVFLFVLVLSIVLTVSYAGLKNSVTVKVIGTTTTPDCNITSYTKEKKIYSQVSGVDPNFLSLDIYTPKTIGICNTKYPVIIYVHGGG